MDIARWKTDRQAGYFAGAQADANPLGDLIYVDSTNGSDGNDGHKPRKAKASIFGSGGALSVAEAGDTIVCAPGGSETVTAAAEIDTDGVAIVCPTRNPGAAGYTVTCSADDNVIEIDAARVTIAGLRINSSASTTTDRAGIVVLGGDGSTATESGRQASIIGCVLNSGATAGKVDVGVRLIGNCADTVVEGCVFRGCTEGVAIDDHASDTDANLRPVIRACRFYVGAAAAFGVYSGASNAVQGLVIEGCEFIEANGDGTAATAAWDGTDGTNATQGPIALSAACDQGIVRDCTAYTALAQSFGTLNAINAGAAVDVVRCHTGEGADVEDKVDTLDSNLDALLLDVGDASADSLGALNLRQGSYGRRVIKTADCTAATPISLFTVTGDVILRVVAVVKTALTTSDAITAEVGVSGATASLIAQVADATDLAINEIWHDASPDATIEALSVLSEVIVSNGQDVILTTTGTVTDGSIAFYCFWTPLSADGAVVAAA